jgi:hypothetical protein
MLVRGLDALRARATERAQTAEPAAAAAAHEDHEQPDEQDDGAEGEQQSEQERRPRGCRRRLDDYTPLVSSSASSVLLLGNCGTCVANNVVRSAVVLSAA